MNHCIGLVDVATKKMRTVLNTRDSAVLSLDSLTGECVLSGHDDGYCRLWDLRVNVNKPVNSFKHHTGIVSSL